jgi:hypothetical protein
LYGGFVAAADRLRRFSAAFSAAVFGFARAYEKVARLFYYYSVIVWPNGPKIDVTGR